MSAATITKDGVQVRVGQVWRDLDKRYEGLRTARVARVTSDGFAIIYSSLGGRQSKATRVAIRRMHKHATGWALVSEPAAPEGGAA